MVFGHTFQVGLDIGLVGVLFSFSDQIFLFGFGCHGLFSFAISG